MKRITARQARRNREKRIDFFAHSMLVVIIGCFAGIATICLSNAF